MVFIIMDYRIQSEELSYLLYCGEKCQFSIKEKKKNKRKRREIERKMSKIQKRIKHGVTLGILRK